MQGAEQKKCVFVEQSLISLPLCSPRLYLSEAILLSDCWAGTDSSCFWAMCMKLRKQESTDKLLSETQNGVGFGAGVDSSCGEGRTLALSRRDVCHCGATLCVAALLVLTACEQMSLSRQQQCSLSLLLWKKTSPDLHLEALPGCTHHPWGAAGPCRVLVESNEALWKLGRCLQRSRSRQCMTPGLHCHREIWI